MLRVIWPIAFCAHLSKYQVSIILYERIRRQGLLLLVFSISFFLSLVGTLLNNSNALHSVLLSVVTCLSYSSFRLFRDKRMSFILSKCALQANLTLLNERVKLNGEKNFFLWTRMFTLRFQFTTRNTFALVSKSHFWNTTYSNSCNSYQNDFTTKSTTRIKPTNFKVLQTWMLDFLRQF